MSISLETLALARKYVGKATGGMEQEIAGKGDTLEYDGSTLTLKSGDKTLSSVTVEGGGGGGGLQYKIVQSIDEIQPAEEGADEYVYLVKKEKAGDHDSYDEYMVIDQAVEKVGDWDVDLSDYVQKNGTDRLMTEEEGEKLSGIQDGANKVEKGTDNGQIKIDGTDTTIYTLPETVVQDDDIADDADVTSMLDDVFGGV